MSSFDGFRWIATSADIAGRYDDIWFISADVGWAVNGNGEILKTENGGISWSDPPQFKDGSVYFRSISMAKDGKSGWAGCTTPNRVLFRSTNGSTWEIVRNLPRQNKSRLEADAPTAVCGLWTLDTDHMVASGTNYPERPARFLSTADGGKSWFARDMEDVATILVDIYFDDEKTGWVVGGRATRQRARRNDVVPTVLKTEDGGKTWKDVLGDLNVPLGEWGWKIQFVEDGQFGVVACENLNTGAILITEDGGKSWRRHEIRDAKGELINQNLEGIGFLDAKTGWVGGWGDPAFDSGRTSETNDGGKTWVDRTRTWPDPHEMMSCPDSRPRGQYINRFRFINGVGYASGNTVYKWTNQEAIEPSREELAPARLLKPAEMFLDDDGLDILVNVPVNANSLEVVIYDRFSGVVKSFDKEENPPPGSQCVRWDLTDDQGTKLKHGQYMVRVTCDGRAESRLVFAKRDWSVKPLNAGLPHVLRAT
ncbi:MAG: hypothetical protein MI923_02945 [Phycisphaerales bacterium]|nr:hypothetical protein [Phycisphaerales bacterium]